MIPAADLRPLTQRVPMGEALTAMRAIERGLPKGRRRPLVFLSVALLVIFVTMTGFELYLLGDSFVDPDGSIDVGMVGIGGVFSLIPLSALAAFVAVWVSYVITARRRWKLARLAAANGWGYEPWSPVVPRAGMYFGTGINPEVADRMVLLGRELEVGRYSSTTGGDTSRSTVRTEYARLRLPRRLPHIVLDATANDSLLGKSTLPIELTGDQRLDLEGDFPKYFRLSAPVGYERDALYLFTPDVMAILVDHARAFDIEIIDDQLFFYAARGIVTTDPHAWDGLLTATGALQRTVAGWDRWSDDRLPERPFDLGDHRRSGVATPGRRLREKTPWFWIILGVVSMGYTLYALGTELFTWVFSLR